MTTSMNDNIYETSSLLDQYLLFHYGTADDVLPHADGPNDALHFAVRTVVENLPSTPVARALDLGCAVGRSSFELSRFSDEVIGIDFSASFIQAAEELRQGRSQPYRRQVEGHLYDDVTAHPPAGCQPERVRFEVGDAMDLRADLGTFQIVHAANLICRLPEPVRLLQRLPELVTPQGSLVITTPCTWLGEYTPPGNWPTHRTLSWLREHLESHFELTTVRDQPFLIREHSRKYQWSVAQASLWTRR
jgi:putative 4-mercaptohistidine N1-methyltranferase